MASFHIVRLRAYVHLLHSLLRCFRKCRANPGGSCLNVQATDAVGFRLFAGQVPAKCETAEARVFTSSLLALRFRTACRDRRCAMPALISSSPQPSAIRRMCIRQLRVEATLSAMSSLASRCAEHDRTCVSVPPAGRPHRPWAEIARAMVHGHGGGHGGKPCKFTHRPEILCW